MGEPRFATGVGVDEVAAAVEEHGYAVVEGLLDPAAIDAKRSDLATLAAQTPLGRNDFEGFSTHRVYALFGKSRAYDDLALHPLLLGVVEKALGPHFQLSAPVGLQLAPGETAQFLHCDDHVYPLPAPHRQVVFNSMWPLCDYTAVNGTTRLVPGSHHWEPGRHPDDGEAVSIEMPAGSALLYVGNLWHGSGANQSDLPRQGILMEYVVSWLRPQETHLLAVPPDVVRDLPTRLQELLGYNIFPPFLGYVDGRHPRRTLT
jgi:ectoine hydroxylase-related dioxygenase (phytanoyl-CoA dioxygenase family)